VRKIQIAEVTTCMHCGEIAEQLMRSKAERSSFAARLPVALAYPFRLEGLALWGGASLFGAVVSYVCLGRWLAAAFIIATAFTITRTSADGGTITSLGLADWVTNLVWPLVRFVVAMAPIWLPEVIFDEPLPVWLNLIITVVGLAWAPFSYIGASTDAGLTASLNPLVIGSVMRRVGRDAVIYVVGAVLLLLAAGALSVPAMALASIGVPVLNKFLPLLVVLYPVFVFARSAGLLVEMHPEPFGFYSADALEPLLGAAAPRGVWQEAAVVEAPKRSHAPIELESAYDDPVARFRAALTAKDAAGLAHFKTGPLPEALSLSEGLSAGRLLAAHQHDGAASVFLERAANSRGTSAEQSGAQVIWARFLAERIGRTDLASQWFSHVVKTHPQTPAATFAQRWLEVRPIEAPLSDIERQPRQTPP